MASGCAVVASNRGGLPEACDGAAAIADPGDFAQVVNIMRKMVNQPEYLAELKQRAVARAAEAAWSHSAELLQNAIEFQHDSHQAIGQLSLCASP